MQSMENPAFKKLNQSPEKWIELRDMLQTALAALPTSEWTPQIEKPSGKMVENEERAFLRQQLVGAYQPHTAETIKAVCAYLRAGQWPALQPQAVYYLRQMLTRPLMFLQGIVFYSNGEHTTIFPFPGDDPSEVFLWFVTEWWTEHGIREVVFEATSDHALFHKYFSL